MQWQSTSDEVRDARVLSEVGGGSSFDFSEVGPYGEIRRGEETIFVDAAWMTMKSTAVSQRDMPFTVRILLRE